LCHRCCGLFIRHMLLFWFIGVVLFIRVMTNFCFTGE
jgi:hypothetical protein